MRAVPRRTVARSASLTGRGLHTDRSVTLVFESARPGQGIVFQRIDLSGHPTVPARLDHARPRQRRTVLRKRGVTVATVEHVLAAVCALGLDDLTIRLDGPEPPAVDGSARPFLNALRDAGVVEQRGRSRSCIVPRAVTVRAADARYDVRPATGLVLDVRIEWSHPLIRRQTGRWTIDAATFATELAGARTFGFVTEREALQRRGLARGASPDNTLVLTAAGLLRGALRWPDEFVRHKALDLLGDLALLGAHLSAEIVAERPSHRGNLALARALAQHAVATTPRAADRPSAVSEGSHP